MIFLASINSTEVSCLVTSTLFPANTLPLPEIGVTLLAANKPLIPPVSFLTISSFLFIIAGRSNSTLSILIP